MDSRRMGSRVGTAIATLDEAASSRTPIAFDAMRDALSASYCLLFAERVDNRQVESPVVEGVDDAYGRRLQLAAAESLLPTWLRGLGEGDVIDRAVMQRDHDFARSEFYNYVIRPEGRFHCLIATPYVTPTRRYHLIVGRPARASDFTAGEAVVLRALLPHVSRLITVTNDAAHAAERADGLLAAFDCLADNILVVRSTGELDFANTGARRVLALQDGMTLAGTRLGAMSAEDTSKLQAAIAQVTSSEAAGDMVLELPRPSGWPPLRLLLRRIVAPAHGSGRPGSSRALILVQQPGSAMELDGSGLARLYGLTCREVEVALLLSEGCDLRQAAATLGMSYQTARFHLRNAFSKTDVHRQSDLVRLVLQTSTRVRQTR